MTVDELMQTLNDMQDDKSSKILGENNMKLFTSRRTGRPPFDISIPLPGEDFAPEERELGEYLKAINELFYICDSKDKPNIEIARDIIKRCYTVNADDRTCRSPLDYARENNHTELVQLLLEAGAVGYEEWQKNELEERTQRLGEVKKQQERLRGALKNNAREASKREEELDKALKRSYEEEKQLEARIEELMTKYLTVKDVMERLKEFPEDMKLFIINEYDEYLVINRIAIDETGRGVVLKAEDE